MLKTVLAFALIAACLALEAEPAQAQFMPAVGSIPEILAQEQLFRRSADIFLGLQISNSFAHYGQLEYQKGQLIAKAPTVIHAFEEASDDEINQLEASDAEVSKKEDLEESDDDVSFVQLKEDVIPMMGAMGGMGGMGAMGMGMMGMGMMGGMGMGMGGMGMGMGGMGMGHPNPTTVAELEEQGSIAKFTALKAMRIQFHLAGADVEKSYWLNKLVAMALPPQLSVFKLYKSYLNTMALSVAHQFYDSFAQEAVVDDFNDRFGHMTGSSSAYTEALAEQHTFSQWSTLAMFKYQLFMINMYEKSMYGQMFASQAAAQADPSANVAQPTSYLEMEPAQTQFMPGMFGGAQSAGYMQYYTMYLKYSSITLEIQLAQAGLMVANSKISSHDDLSSHNENAIQMESQYLPMLFAQWGQTNQMKYYLEYYGLMTEMFFPQLASAQAADRAENSIQNLVQTEAPVIAKAN